MERQAGLIVLTARLDGSWLRGLQVCLWLAVVLAFLAVYALDLRLSYALISRPCDGPDCHYQAVGPAEAQALVELGLSPQAYAFYMLGITVLGVAVFCRLALVMAWRLFLQEKGLLFSAMLVLIPTTAITSFDVVAAAFPAGRRQSTCYLSRVWQPRLASSWFFPTGALRRAARWFCRPSWSPPILPTCLSKTSVPTGGLPFYRCFLPSWWWWFTATGGCSIAPSASKPAGWCLGAPCSWQVCRSGLISSIWRSRRPGRSACC